MREHFTRPHYKPSIKKLVSGYYSGTSQTVKNRLSRELAEAAAQSEDELNNKVAFILEDIQDEYKRLKHINVMQAFEYSRFVNTWVDAYKAARASGQI